MSKGNDLFIAIDGNAIIHRAFHAYPPTLTTTDGIQVNAVYGFTIMLLQVLKQFEPKYVMCAFDTSKPTFRHTKYSAYKAHRKPTDHSLIAQFPIVEQVLKAMNIPIVKKDGYEADDIIGTVSKYVEDGKWNGNDCEMYLITGDRDFLQLIGEKVKVCIPQGSFSNLGIFDRESTFSKYGYYPEQVVEYKGLVGDASDNIPGIKGVGEKTAITLLQKYGNLMGIYSHIDELTGRAATLIKEGQEQADFSKDLATINRGVDLDLRLESCLLKDFNEEEVVAIFKKLEFRSLISKIPKSITEETKGGQLGMFGEKIAENVPQKVLEVTNLQIFAYFGKEEFENSPLTIEFTVDNEGKLSTSLNVSFTLKESCETWFYNFEDWIALNLDKNVDISSFYDIKLLSHTLSSGKKSYNISDLAFEYSSRNLEEKVGVGNLNKVGEALVDIVVGIKERMHKTKLNDYSQKWVDVLGEMYPSTGLNPFETVQKHVDLPLAVVLAKMEVRGMKVNRDKLEGLDKLLTKEVESISSEIFKEIGHEFNLNSPKQLSDVLFTELRLPANNDRSTREEVLISLKDTHPCIELILKYREVSKLLSTYIKPLLEYGKTNGEYAVHSDFKMLGSSSGRFASVNPNMQNIPARGTYASQIREIFVPREGFVMVGADYSQIEFRIMADVSQDEVLMNDFVNGKDIHLATAARVLEKKEGEITKDERTLGKTINFAILFGQTAFGLSRLANIHPTVAKTYIQGYFDTFKGVAKYIESAKEVAMKFGYAQSMFGRTRHIAGLSSRNRNVLSAAIREAINMPIQGGEADIMRLAMVEIQKMIEEKYSEKAYMQLQIHDELIFEVKEGMEEEFKKDVKKIMENIVKLNVPLEVNVSHGNNMSELK